MCVGPEVPGTRFISRLTKIGHPWPKRTYEPNNADSVLSVLNTAVFISDPCTCGGSSYQHMPVSYVAEYCAHVS